LDYTFKKNEIVSQSSIIPLDLKIEINQRKALTKLLFCWTQL